jgi:hypothetical protein
MRRKQIWMEHDLTGNIHPDVFNYNQVSRFVTAAFVCELGRPIASISGHLRAAAFLYQRHAISF